MVKRLRAERPDQAFTISSRINRYAETVHLMMRGTLSAYRDGEVQHVTAAPEDRDIDPYLNTAEARERSGVGL